MICNYPSTEDWQRIAASFPVKQLQVKLNDFQRRNDPPVAEPHDLFIRHETTNWEIHLQHRIRDTWKSYVLLNFFYNMGIPDNEWSIQNENGATVYFPHFDKTHYEIKDQFDFYTDIFYYKVFSAWDTLGHILCLVYRLKLRPKDRPSFALAIANLRDVDRTLFDGLEEIRNDPEFIKARNFRHDITHNFLSNSLGSDVRMPDKNMMTFGGRTYTPSTVFKKNVFQTLHLFAKSLELMKDRIGLNNEQPESANNSAEA